MCTYIYYAAVWPIFETHPKTGKAWSAYERAKTHLVDDGNRMHVVAALQLLDELK